MRFEIAAQSIRGGRSYQEDTWTLHALNGNDLTSSAASANGIVVPSGALVVVADGMGGEGGGAEASRLVAEHFARAFFAEASADRPPGERLRAALEDANRGLLAAKQRRKDLREKSGSTLIAGLVQDGALHFLSVGDSSIWRCRDEEIHRINILHERAPEMDVRAAELDTEEAWDIVLHDTQRNSITAAVMGLPLEAQHSQIALRPVVAGDVLIFASDGIETLSIEHLRRSAATILARRNAAALAQALVRMVERLGTKDQDNTTVVVVHALPESARTQIMPASKGSGAGAPPSVARAPGDGPAEPVAKGRTVPTVRGSKASPWGTVTLVAAAATLVATVAVASLLLPSVLPTGGGGPAEKSPRPAAAAANGSGAPASSPPGPQKPARNDAPDKDATPRPAARLQENPPPGSPLSAQEPGPTTAAGSQPPPPGGVAAEPANGQGLPTAFAPVGGPPGLTVKPGNPRKKNVGSGTASTGGSGTAPTGEGPVRPSEE